ncbi:hypothetical protein [Acuticoccus sp. I52.16.1]|uniref:hypothetical protein n=1 Tax=Acuticoccus sp. I52.16.1 TaxID=2928472 RepID=UPI001FD4F204|nr:hypothetical protein [Acuticoccus sp. I52.16.1]UOM33497.1 hypothetical protein MRB58_16810 [Acuticoccus sp. I52.16.1]
MRLLFRAMLLPLAVLPVAGCVIADAYDAAEGRSDIVGLTKTELRMCAGFPTKTMTEGGTEIWSYVRSSAAGTSVTLPTLPTLISIPGPSFSQSSTMDCRAQMRFAEGKVVEVAYAGATDVMGAEDAACGEIVRGCIGYVPGRGQPPASPPPTAPTDDRAPSGR